jgi:hypothetical protein
MARLTTASTVPFFEELRVPGRYHSVIELTMPNNSRLTRRGSMSPRISPASAAALTSAASLASMPRRRASASRSMWVLPLTRSSNVT